MAEAIKTACKLEIIATEYKHSPYVRYLTGCWKGKPIIIINSRLETK